MNAFYCFCKLRRCLRTELETLQLSASERQRHMPKVAAIHYLNVYRSGKSRSRWAKNKDCRGSLMSADLPNMNVLGQVIAVLEPENRKVGQTVLNFLAKFKVTYAIYSLTSFRAV